MRCLLGSLKNSEDAKNAKSVRSGLMQGRGHLVAAFPGSLLQEPGSECRALHGRRSIPLPFGMRSASVPPRFYTTDGSGTCVAQAKMTSSQLDTGPAAFLRMFTRGLAAQPGRTRPPSRPGFACSRQRRKRIPQGFLFCQELLGADSEEPVELEAVEAAEIR